jgi:integrase
MKLAVKNGWRHDDPTIGINPVERHSDGFHTWTEDEIATFRRVFPIGTRQRLAFELMLNTAQRRADVVRMGWQHIESGKILIGPR